MSTGTGHSSACLTFVFTPLLCMQKLLVHACRVVSSFFQGVGSMPGHACCGPWPKAEGLLQGSVSFLQRSQQLSAAQRAATKRG